MAVFSVKQTSHYRRSGRFSHYQRFNYNSDKTFPYQVKRRSADLISTWILNPLTKSLVVYMLQVDLDFADTDERFIEDGKISWRLLREYLSENHAYLLRYIFAATRSHGGRGMSIAIAISPVLVTKNKNSANETLALKLNRRLVELFRRAGCGADPGATGTERKCTNWNTTKEDKILFRDLGIKRRIECERPPVLADIMNELNKDPLMAYQKKTDQMDQLLYPRIGVEKKLVKLFKKLQGSEEPFNATQVTLQGITEICRPTLKQIVEQPPPWLVVKPINKRAGYELRLADNYESYLPRLEELQNTAYQPRINPGNGFAIQRLKEPSAVLKGERNKYITNCGLRLKWLGVDPYATEEHLRTIVGQIPGNGDSRNCRAVGNIISSIYRSRPETFGIAPQSVDYPEWLLPQNCCSTKGSNKRKLFLEASPSLCEEKHLRHVRSVVENVEVFAVQDSTLVEPVDRQSVPGLHLVPQIEQIPFPSEFEEGGIKKVGVDRHFQYKAIRVKSKKKKETWYWSWTYYSAPYTRDHKVFVAKVGDELLVFTSDKKTFLCRHRFVREPWGYRTYREHLRGFDPSAYVRGLRHSDLYQPADLARWEKQASMKGYGYQSLRRIQASAREYRQILEGLGIL